MSSGEARVRPAQGVPRGGTSHLCAPGEGVEGHVKRRGLHQLNSHLEFVGMGGPRGMSE